MSEQLPETQRQQVDTLSALIVKHLRIARRNHMDSPLGKAANVLLQLPEKVAGDVYGFPVPGLFHRFDVNTLL